MHAALADDLRDYAVKRWPTANHKFRKARLADLLGMTERRVRSFWEANREMSPRAEEVAAIKALIGEKEKTDDADRSLAQRLARVEAELAEVHALLAITKQRLERGTSVSEGAESRF